VRSVDRLPFTSVTTVSTSFSSVAIVQGLSGCGDCAVRAPRRFAGSDGLLPDVGTHWKSAPGTAGRRHRLLREKGGEQPGQSVCDEVWPQQGYLSS
jgi:hypothetical protein